MGHIDSGKTTLLDKIKGTNICAKEAGKITQHIGATEIPLKVIKQISGDLLSNYKYDIKLPGLLFIDTPGHSAFDNLRERGGSLADLVILIVDINKGLQAQDIETLEILKLYKVPFILAANKIDLINGWHQNDCSFSKSLKEQDQNTLDKLDEKIYKLVGQLYDHGFIADRFDRVEDFKKKITIIPISAERSWGLPELILFLSVLTQKFLDKKLKIDPLNKPQATVLEVGTIKGIGASADCIVYQGVFKVRDKIVFPTKNGLEESKIKALLKINVLSAVDKKKQKYKNLNYVSAASGVKLVANNIDKCIPGGSIVHFDDKKAVEHLKKKSYKCFSKIDENGAFVKADTLGSLEALIKLLDQENICVSKSDIGDFTAKDLLELKILHKEDPKKGVLFLFNTKIPKDLELEIQKEKIPIFKNNIIYKLIEDYQDWLEAVNNKEKQKLLKELIYPCVIKILPNHIFRSSKPAVVGVRVIKGRLVAGSYLLNSNNKIIGKIINVQDEGKNIDIANKDQEVAISIDGATYLKDFKEKDKLTIKLNKDMISKLEKIKDELSSEEIDLLVEAKKRNKEENKKE
jgi:translation initiation factor 5B